MEPVDQGARCRICSSSALASRQFRFQMALFAFVMPTRKAVPASSARLTLFRSRRIIEQNRNTRGLPDVAARQFGTAGFFASRDRPYRIRGGNGLAHASVRRRPSLVLQSSFSIGHACFSLGRAFSGRAARDRAGYSRRRACSPRAGAASGHRLRASKAVGRAGAGHRGFCRAGDRRALRAGTGGGRRRPRPACHRAHAGRPGNAARDGGGAEMYRRRRRPRRDRHFPSPLHARRLPAPGLGGARRRRRGPDGSAGAGWRCGAAVVGGDRPDRGDAAQRPA